MNVYIETYGCQMNEYDSELVRAILHDHGFRFTPTIEQADIILINTCSVREHATRKIYARVHKLRHVTKDKKVFIGVLGCMVTNLGSDLFSLPVNFLAGPDSYRHLPDIIDNAVSEETPVLHNTLDKKETYRDIYPIREKGVNAWISVMRGCNNFCSFCVVPYTRGRERSRSIEEVCRECEKLAQEGFKQVTLLGQNVNSYRYKGYDFAYLLEKISEITGIERIRFTSPHPKDFPLSLMRAIAQNPKLCNHIHLPLQAGNDRILNLMRRTYTQSQYLQLVDKIRQAIPGIALTTDIIVGFPTESRAEFEDTVKVVDTIRFDSAFIFKYSPRQGTLAAKKYSDDVDAEEKTRRIVTLNHLQKQISLEINRSHIGETQKILLEKNSTKKSQQDVQGRNEGNKIVIIPRGPYQVGDLLEVAIQDAGAHTLKGRVVAHQS